MRIFYSTVFTTLYIITSGLLLITPADCLHQALGKKQIYKVFAIVGAYSLTFFVAVILYLARLYAKRSVLAGIPKTWIPIEKGDVNKKVRRMIAESLSRSAVIAWNARPRVSTHMQAVRPILEMQDIVEEAATESKYKTKLYHKLFRKKHESSEKEGGQLVMPPHPPVWGDILHEGWSSPSSTDPPNLQYITVIQELPHLVEAKAVSLVPSDVNSTAMPPTPDFRAIEILRRPMAMSFRDYISHLAGLGILSPTVPVASFLSQYENARFSSHPLSELDFRELMRLFAEILRSMTALAPEIIQSIEQDDSDIDGDVSSTTTPETPRSRSPTSSYSPASRLGSGGTVRTAPSRRIPTGHSVSRQSAFGTAPTTPSKNDRIVERSPSLQSFSQTRRPYVESQASSGSLRSLSSVIRLNQSQSSVDLPYTLEVRGRLS